MDIKQEICHDCNVKEGELHELGCDMETCPFCRNQLISCDCCYKLLNIKHTPETWEYHNGLTDEQEEQWSRMLDVKGRIPYIQVLPLCRMCGKLYPDVFNIPDEEWEKVVIPELQGEMLCWKCYQRMKQLFPNGWRKV